MAEYDAAGCTPDPADGARHRTHRAHDGSKRGEVKSGTSTVLRSNALSKQVKVSRGVCEAASGRITVRVKDEQLGRPATLTVDGKSHPPLTAG